MRGIVRGARSRVRGGVRRVPVGAAGSSLRVASDDGELDSLHDGWDEVETDEQGASLLLMLAIATRAPGSVAQDPVFVFELTAGARSSTARFCSFVETGLESSFTFSFSCAACSSRV